jgi:hypothetical protein
LNDGRQYPLHVVLNAIAGSIQINGTTDAGLMSEFGSLSNGENSSDPHKARADRVTEMVATKIREVEK